jgi:hypothetical protein
MRFLLSCAFALLLGLPSADAQSFIFGVKGGLAMGLQQWNGFQRDPLFKYHADAYIESWQEENKYSLFAALGYHVRGGTIRTRSWVNDDGTQFPGGKTNMEFNNIVLTLGGKQKFPVGLDSRLYYSVSIRGEYTAGTNFNGYMETYEGLENKFVFGVGLGAGVEVPFSRWVGGIFEVTVNPDFTKQIFLPPQDTGFSDPNGNLITIPEQNVTNLTIEFTLGLRFLREVIYVD